MLHRARRRSSPSAVAGIFLRGARRQSDLRGPLTTVEQPLDEIAQTAVEALRALVDDPGQTLPSYVFRPTLRGGGTTGPPR